MGDQGKFEPALEMDEKNPQTSSRKQEEAASSHIDIHDNLEEPFDEAFWEKVNFIILNACFALFLYFRRNMLINCIMLAFFGFCLAQT